MKNFHTKILEGIETKVGPMNKFIVPTYETVYLLIYIFEF
jgi:hypothetical protein